MVYNVIRTYLCQLSARYTVVPYHPSVTWNAPNTLVRFKSVCMVVIVSWTIRSDRGTFYRLVQIIAPFLFLPLPLIPFALHLLFFPIPFLSFISLLLFLFHFPFACLLFIVLIYTLLCSGSESLKAVLAASVQCYNQVLPLLFSVRSWSVWGAHNW